MSKSKLWTKRALRRKPSPIRELIPYLSIPDLISFGGGYPNPETFAFKAMSLTLSNGQKLLLNAEEMYRATQYSATRGLDGLVSKLVQWQKWKDHVDLEIENLAVLNGSQEGLSMVGDLLLEQGDAVLISEPSYSGAMAAFQSYGIQFIPILIDDQGMKVEEIPEILKKNPSIKLIYTIPNGHNPSGTTLSLERRKKLVQWAHEYKIWILEDDPYELLHFEAKRLPTLQALEIQNYGKIKWVIRLDSFSKILCPGMRLGYLSADRALVDQLILYKQAANLHTSSMAQAILDLYFRTQGFQVFMQEIRQNVLLYQRARDLTVQAIQKYLPEARFSMPNAGMFLWLRFDRDIQSHFTKGMAQYKVLAVPGSAFSTQGKCKNALRLSYSLVPIDRIDEGIRRLAQLLAS